MAGMSRDTGPWVSLHYGVRDHARSDRLTWKAVHEGHVASGTDERSLASQMPTHRRLPGMAPSWSWLSISGLAHLFNNGGGSSVVNSL